MLSTGASSQASVDDVIQDNNNNPGGNSSSQNQLGQSGNNGNPSISFSNIVDFLKEHQR